MRHRKYLYTALATLACAVPAHSIAAEEVQLASANDYFNLPLESLLNVEVTSVSKKKEKASRAAAAIQVITSEDIRRMGATTIAEALRPVPGIQVSQIDSNKWAISSRGFNQQFTNDLLVMIDGRSIYTPVFSGVYWDMQDLVLDDIDRIEVIRGPGGTVWGANAVNGVINIITKKAKDTKGTYATVTAGNHEKALVEARQGGETKDGANYRVYAKYTDRGQTKNVLGADNHDEWNRQQVGFRYDKENTGRENNDSYTIQGDAYYGENNSEFVFPSLSAPYSTSQIEEDNMLGGNVLARWNRDFSADSNLRVQTYFDHTRRNETLGEQWVSTYDFDLVHQFKTTERNEVVWGTGYRVQKDEIIGNAYVQMDDPRDVYDLWSAFIQDQYALVPDKLFLTAGSKFEVNDFTGFNYQPSVKLSWNVDEKQTIWGSVSRAVETPNRLTDGVTAVATALPPSALFPGSPAGFTRLVGQGGIDNQYLTAYELGYRVVPRNDVLLDFAVFYNDYSDLVTTELGSPLLETTSAFPPHLSIPISFDNKSSGTSYGIETSANWQVMENWKLSAGYAYIDINIKLDPGSTDTTQIDSVKGTPRHQFNLHSSLNIAKNIEMDNYLYFIDNFEANGFTSTLSVPEYWRFDTRIGWKINETTELSVVGQNLLDERHSEQAAPVYGNAAQIERSFFARVTKRF